MPGPVIPALLRSEASKLRTNHRAPRRHEKTVAQKLGGRRTPGSGSGKWNKGDVRGIEAGCFEFVGECKTTERNTLRLEADWLAKITAEAGSRRFPSLAIRFTREVISQAASKYGAETEQDWVMIPLSVFEKIQAALAEGQDES